MNYEILANAIVEQAVKDYRWARTALGSLRRSGSFVPHGLGS